MIDTNTVCIETAIAGERNGMEGQGGGQEGREHVYNSALEMDWIRSDPTWLKNSPDRRSGATSDEGRDGPVTNVLVDDSTCWHDPDADSPSWVRPEICLATTVRSSLTLAFPRGG